LRKAAGGSAGLVVHSDGDRGTHQVPDARGIQHRLGGLVVGDEGHDAVVAARCGAQQQLDAAA
jgi:hypothetical protein